MAVLARRRSAVARLQRLDSRLSRGAERAVTSAGMVGVLVAVSRFGDWALSALTGAVLLAVSGPSTAGRFALATAVGLLVQVVAKRGFARVRPCLTADGPLQRAPIPDAGSFPSGHTLHAVLAAVVATVALPPLAVVYIPLAMLMALSRVALGVHYPTDVVAGASLGAALSLLVL